MLEGFGIMKHISVAAWTWFGSFTTLCFIAGAAIDRARLIAKGKVDETAIAADIPVPTPDKPPVDPAIIAPDDIREHGASTHDIDIDSVGDK